MGYDIVANIRVNNYGKDILYHDGFKFRKNKINPNTISWICCKRDSQKCKSMASTKDIDGITVMKLNGIEHTHEPDFD